MQGDFFNIITTTYDIVESFPDEDPLKATAKETALSLLRHVRSLFGSHGWVSFKAMFHEQQQIVAQKILQDIDLLEDYLRLGKRRGWVSGMNFLILIKEYAVIKDAVISIQKSAPKALLRIDQDNKQRIEDSSVKVLENQEKELPIHEVKEKHYSKRQEHILKILDNREKVQVADIIKEIPDITKRTIRRDLDELLKRGEVVRTGEFNQVFYQKSNRT